MAVECGEKWSWVVGRKKRGASLYHRLYGYCTLPHCSSLARINHSFIACTYIQRIYIVYIRYHNRILATSLAEGVLVVSGVAGDVSEPQTRLVRPVSGALVLPAPVEPALTVVLEDLCLGVVELAHELLVLAVC